MKIYIVCPRFKTGGPENMHQLCDYLNTLGEEAYMYYYPNPENNLQPLYPEFKNIRVCSQIEDLSNNIVIVPEIYRIKEIRQSIQKAVLAIWWLSYTNACLFGVLQDNLYTDPYIIHLFHSYYEYAMVRPHLQPTTRWFFITDYIHDEFLQLNPDHYQERKQNYVCFNGNKDKITPYICQIANIPHISITNMSREQVFTTLQQCKLYVDNGFHPGKDHLPREAAMNGCVVITNKCGSAAYMEDVPIDEKITLENELFEMIPRILNDYQQYYLKQQSYRQFIKNEKHIFETNVKTFISKIKNELS